MIFSGIPAIAMWLAAVWRKSWNRKFSIPANVQAFSKEVRTSLKGFPFFPIFGTPANR
jgi:hypothetical protein